MSRPRPGTPSSADHPDPHRELLEGVARELSDAAPAGWFRIDLTFLATAPVSHASLAVLMPGGDMVPVRIPTPVGHALRALRDLMYRPGAGTWFSLRFTVDPPLSYRVMFNFDHDPNWSPGIEADAWRADLATYPRDPEHVPDWLRARLAEPTPGY
ncbi:hypothetical protein [Actinosynnema sp. NPDC020468]|uniref:hypothetical protein n=1 Tax=Actinosynnema sp. NPDC020468 TaxID=3154488 RepID=UPI0033E2F391